jgi:GNAT superfamily N-acetyltransferase
VSPYASGRGLRNRLAIGYSVTREAAIEPPASSGPASVRTLTAPTRREIEELAEIFDQYRAHYGEAPDAARSVTWLERNLKSSRFRAFVATGQGQSIGFAITMEVPASLRLGHFWQIRDLFVLPHKRRLGVGRALLDSLRTAAIAAGALRLVLQTENDNEPALRLYTESGYTMVEGYRSLTLPLSPDSRGANRIPPHAKGSRKRR